MAVKSKSISKPLLDSQVIRFMALVSPTSATQTYDVQQCGKQNLKNCCVDVFNTMCIFSTAFLQINTTYMTQVLDICKVING